MSMGAGFITFGKPKLKLRPFHRPKLQSWKNKCCKEPTWPQNIISQDIQRGNKYINFITLREILMNHDDEEEDNVCVCHGSSVLCMYVTLQNLLLMIFRWLAGPRLARRMIGRTMIGQKDDWLNTWPYGWLAGRLDGQLAVKPLRCHDSRWLARGDFLFSGC